MLLNEQTNDMARNLNWSTMHKITQSWWGILLGSLLFTLLMLFDIIFPLKAIMPSRDYVLQLWDLWIVNENIIHGQSPYVTNLQYHPVGAILGKHVLSPGFFPVTFLVYLLSGGDVFYPLYTYKIIILLSYGLIFYFSYLTLREIEINAWSAVIVAVAYAFGDFYMNHLSRIHVISGFFIPLSAFLLIKLYKKPSFGWLLACSTCFATSLYFTEFALFIYQGTFFFAIGLLLLPKYRPEVIAKIKDLGLVRFVTAFLVSLIIIVPFVYYWVNSEAIPPKRSEAVKYSSNFLSFFVPTEQATPLYGTLFNSINETITAQELFTFGVIGFEVFIGFPLIVAGGIALFKVRNSLGWLCFIGAILFFALSLGPTLRVYNIDTGVPMPYALLASIPPFNFGRNPVRFIALGLFFWMIFAGFGLHWLYTALSKRYSTAIATTILLVGLIWTIAEVYTPVEQEPVYENPPQLAQVIEGPVLNLPLVYHDGWSLLYQMFHRQPVSTGYVSRNSPEQKAHFETLRVYYALSVEENSCTRFTDMGFRNVFVWNGVPDQVVQALQQSPTCTLNVVDFRQ